MSRWALICAMALLLSALVVAQDDAMQQQLADIRGAVVEMRQLQPLRETPLAIPDRAEVEAYLRQRFAREYSAESLESDLYFYRALDLAEAGLDLEALLLDYALDWIGGYYDLAADRINITVGEAGDVLTIPQQMIYAHEWVHALQDQHFDLDRIIGEAWAGDRDQRLAMQALIEGDANLIMNGFLGGLLAADRSAAQRAFDALPQPELDEGLPRVIEKATYFPYEAGQRFVQALIAARGLEGLNQASLEDPPQTTEQIYHPGRYLAGDGAIEVNMPDLSAIVGEGWRLVYAGPVGEFYLRQHLAPYIHEARLHRMTTAGWGGDRMQVYANEADDSLAWALDQVWDSPLDAAEFFYDYRSALGRRYGRGTAVGICFRGAATRCIARTGERETRISQAQDSDLARALLRLHDRRPAVSD